MTPRSRVLTYGTATALVVAGLACVVAFEGLVAEVAAIALTSAGLGAVVLLVFFEVGLSEDRDRAEGDEPPPERGKGHDAAPRVSLRRHPRRPS